MNGTEDSGLHSSEPPMTPARGPLTRVQGSPLPVGESSRPPLPPRADAAPGIQTPQLSGRGLTHDASATDAASVQKAVSALRTAFPFLQKLLPLLENNLGNAVSSFLTTQTTPHPPAPPVNLEPIESNLAELRSHQRDLRSHIAEQSNSLKRVEDRLEMVREATDRNTLEQQELLEDLKTVGTKVNFFAVLVLVMLAGSVLLNILLYLHINRILP